MDCTVSYVRLQRSGFVWKGWSSLLYLMVATSELVESLAGPATGVGSLATTRLALSQVKMKTLLYPPPFFSYYAMELAPGHSSITLLRSASKSKVR